jgi:hypothetical protein
MEYRVINLPPLVLSPNNFYLYYNEDGDILSLTNEKLSDGNYIEVSEKFVIDFLESKKEIRNFKVRISDQVKLEQKNIESKNHFNFIVIRENKNAKLLITVKPDSLIFCLQNFEKTFVINDKRHYGFAIVSDSNLNFVKKILGFTLDQLMNGITIDYRLEKGKDILITTKEFESYGIIYDSED